MHHTPLQNALRLMLGLALSLPLLATASTHDNGDIDKVNGSIHVDAGQTAGKLSTVNGSIHVADGAHVSSAATVNGAVDIGAQIDLDTVETVNGGIVIGEQTKVRKTIEAVNGSISLGQGSDVVGRVSNVNGGIELKGAHVGGGIETVSGGVTIGADSRLEGGLLVKKPSGGWFNFGIEKKPRIVIGPHAQVQGGLTFNREAELYVSTSASVDKIDGATAVTFSGDSPAD